MDTFILRRRSNQGLTSNQVRDIGNSTPYRIGDIVSMEEMIDLLNSNQARVTVVNNDGQGTDTVTSNQIIYKHNPESSLTERLSLSDEDKKTISICAQNYVRLHLIEDNVPLTTMMETKFNELCEFYDAVTGCYKICVVGEGVADHAVRQERPLYHQERADYFEMEENKFLWNFLNDLRKGLIRRMPYMYSRDVHNGLHRDHHLKKEEYHEPDYQPDPSSMVCWPGEEAPKVEPLPFLATVKLFDSNERTDKPIDYPGGSADLARHHIISLKLLKKFYAIHEELRTNQYFNGKYGHIDRRFFNIYENSVRKLRVVQLWGIYTNSGPCDYKHSSLPENFPQNARMDIDEKFRDILRQEQTWSLGANIFWGPKPEERGPFDPIIRNLDFEFDSEIIIGKYKYEKCFNLYQKIDRFMKKNPNERTEQEANHIANSIHSVYSFFEISPYNKDHWIKRAPTEDELGSFKMKEKRKYRGKEFWAIKKVEKTDAPVAGSSHVDNLTHQFSSLSC